MPAVPFPSIKSHLRARATCAPTCPAFFCGVAIHSCHAVWLLSGSHLTSAQLFEANPRHVSARPLNQHPELLWLAFRNKKRSISNANFFASGCGPTGAESPDLQVSMANILSSVQAALKPAPSNHGNVEFWHQPERAGWLMKQGGSPLHLSYPAARAVPPLDSFGNGLHGAQLCTSPGYLECNASIGCTWISLLLLYYRQHPMALAYLGGRTPQFGFSVVDCLLAAACSAAAAAFWCGTARA